jgi:hypothetical protein
MYRTVFHMLRLHVTRTLLDVDVDVDVVEV